MFYIKEAERSDFRRGGGLIKTLRSLTYIPDLSSFDLQEMYNDFHNQNSLVFLAMIQSPSVNKQIVGLVKLYFEQKIFRGGLRVCHIEELVTRDGFEGRGISKALVKTVKKVAKKRGCYKIILSCQKEMIGFYKKHGFKESEVLMGIDF